MFGHQAGWVGGQDWGAPAAAPGPSLWVGPCGDRSPSGTLETRWLPYCMWRWHDYIVIQMIPGRATPVIAATADFLRPIVIYGRPAASRVGQRSSCCLLPACALWRSSKLTPEGGAEVGGVSIAYLEGNPFEGGIARLQQQARPLHSALGNVLGVAAARCRYVPVASLPSARSIRKLLPSFRRRTNSSVLINCCPHRRLTQPMRTPCALCLALRTAGTPLAEHRDNVSPSCRHDKVSIHATARTSAEWLRRADETSLHPVIPVAVLLRLKCGSVRRPW